MCLRISAAPGRVEDELVVTAECDHFEVAAGLDTTKPFDLFQVFLGMAELHAKIRDRLEAGLPEEVCDCAWAEECPDDRTNGMHPLDAWVDVGGSG